MARKKKLDADTLLSRCLSLIDNQLTSIEADEKTLDTARLADIMRTLVMLKREDRQTKVTDELEKLGDADMFQLAQQAIKYIENTDKSYKDTK